MAKTKTTPSSTNPNMYYVLTKNGIEVRYRRSGNFAYLLPKGSTRYKNALNKRYTNIYRSQYGNKKNNNSTSKSSSSGSSTTSTNNTSTDTTTTNSKDATTTTTGSNGLKDIEYDPEEFTPETPYTTDTLIHKNSPAHFVMLDVYETDEENWKSYKDLTETDPLTGEDTNNTTEKKEDKDEEKDKDTENTLDIDTLIADAQKETEDEDKGYYLHQGEIKETHNYYQTFNASYEGDYSNFKNTGKIKFPRLTRADLKHIYKGVRCLLKYGRFQPDNTEKTIHVRPVFLSFITESNFDSTSSEFTLENEGALLEEKEELSYNDTLRSEIIKEVIRNAGLTPEVDFRGLQDETISWTSTTSSGGSSGGSTAGQSSTLTDCSTSHEISHGTGCYVSTRGAIPSPVPSKALEKICNTSANYYQACHGKSSREVMSILRNGFKYSRYSDNKDKCASQSFNRRGALNCGDSARLVKASMDSANVPCILIHVSGHYYNAVNDGSGWKTVDLCYTSDMGKKGGTNELGY